MSNLCILFGEIKIQSEGDAKKLHTIMKRRLYIDSYSYNPKKRLLVIDVGFDKLKHIDWLEKYVYPKVAECIPENAFGRLYFKEGQFFSCIYFGKKKVKISDYNQPDAPSWWKGET